VQAPKSSEATRSTVDPQERIGTLLGHLATSRDGLSAREVERRLQQHGLNQITRQRGPGRFVELSRQFRHPLALLLWIAAALAGSAGNTSLAVAIVAVILINAVLAFLQEVQAERATEALQEYLPPHARVRRDGTVHEIDARLLVPGDILVLEGGDRLSADARLISGAVELDMAALTGESSPVARLAEATYPAASPLEAADLVFSGTLCTEGDAEAVVYATGMATQLGRIATLSQRVRVDPSPLQRQVNRAAWLIAAIAVASGAIFFVAGISLVGLSLGLALTAAIGILVGNVPEGLLPTITLSLAGAVRRMARRRALVKRLTAVETLGSTDVICTDKTGTLTEGRMRARHVWTSDGEITLSGGSHASQPLPSSHLGSLMHRIAHTSAQCNNATLNREDGATRVSGDPSEVALLLAAEELGEDVGSAQSMRPVRRRHLYSFDPRLKCMTTLDEEPDGSLAYHTKGAPLEVMERCTAIQGPAGKLALTEQDRQNVRRAIDGYASSGLRVFALAERESAGREPASRDEVESGLTLLGLIAIEDPLRPDVIGAVAQCRHAGIRIIMVTGDYGPTAEAIARQAGIVTGTPVVVTGSDVDTMSQHDLDHLLHETPELIVARSNPETKLHMVDALRHEGHTVAMTGDGVNDAPALRRADIGVAMGASGTDVAREAATMILTDDKFSSIIGAVREGRVVFDNVQKFITYIFIHAPAEALPFIVFAVAAAAIPLPLLPLQILAIDLGTDTVPALALGREPAEPGVMDRPPRPRQSGVLQRFMLYRAWLRMGIVEALLALGGFFFTLVLAGWHPGDGTGPGSPLHDAYVRATTMTWAGIVAGQVGAAFAARTTTASLRQIGVWTNGALILGIAFELAFAATIVYAPPLQGLFHTAPLAPQDLGLLASFPFIVWGSDELYRAWRRSSSARSAREDPRTRPRRASVEHECLTTDQLK
jgi:calcium-translocating P-type ATPase